jgi:hypothetical protein
MALLYLTAPGNIPKAFQGIIEAKTPEKVSQDFVKTVLRIPGGSGDAMTSFLRRLGFVSADGSPSEIYRLYRNPDNSKIAMAQAIRIAYQALSVKNEFFFKLTDDKLKGMIVEITGDSADSRSVSLTVQTLRHLINLADFDAVPVSQSIYSSVEKTQLRAENNDGTKSDANDHYDQKNGRKLNIGYTINLNLPATSDIEVFNAIFKSLKEHILNE